MKSVLFSFLFLLLPKLCISQLSANDEAVYNLGSAENYRYIRIIKDYKISNKEEYLFRGYYKSGNIKTKGATSIRIGIT